LGTNGRSSGRSPGVTRSSDPVRASSPSLCCRVDQGDDDSLNVLLLSDSPFAQFLRKPATEFQRDDEPHVIWDWRPLGAASNGDPGGLFGLGNAATTSGRSGKGEGRLLSGNQVRADAEPGATGPCSVPPCRLGGSLAEATAGGVIGCDVRRGAGIGRVEPESARAGGLDYGAPQLASSA